MEKMDLFMLSLPYYPTQYSTPKDKFRNKQISPRRMVPPMGTFASTPPYLHTTPALKLQNFTLKALFSPLINI
ncbi:hypothetical protein ES703_42620 [subsurface metagenome]